MYDERKGREGGGRERARENVSYTVYMYEGHRTTSVFVGPYLLPCLRQGIFISTVKSGQLACKVVGILLSRPPVALLRWAGIFDTCLYAWDFTCFRDLYSDTHLCDL